MGRILAIDFGKVRLGLAITDPCKIIAQPLPCIKAEKTHLATAQKIAKELSRYTPLEAIVLGLPLLLSGKEGEMALLVKAFKQALEEVFAVPVTLLDERLSSAQVERELKSLHFNRKERAERSDSGAAAILLSLYLEMQCNDLKSLTKDP